MADVVLVNPVDNAQLKRNVGLISPPLSLMYLAGYLRKSGYSVKILDDNRLGIGPAKAARRIAYEDPFLVGLTATTSSINSALSYLRPIKAELPNSFTVIGGVHSSFLPHETLQASNHLDAVAIGEGEETLRELASFVSSKKPASLREIKGIAYKTPGGKVKVNPPRPLIEDLDTIPLPARDLVDYCSYRDPVTKKPFGSMMTSRGCVFGCSYCCSSRLMGRRFRERSPACIAEEMEQLLDYGAGHIEFLDDNFMLNRKRARAVAQEMKARGLDTYFVACSRVDGVERSLFQDLKRAGMTSIFYGIESGCQRILNLMNKGITIQQVKDAVKTARREKIGVIGSFILGYPGETKVEMEQTIRYAASLRVDFAQFAILTPYPGTPIYEQLLKEGAIAQRNFSKYTILDPIIDYEKLGMSTKVVSGMLRKAYWSFYVRPSYLFRHPSMIRLVPTTIARNLMGGF